MKSILCPENLIMDWVKLESDFTIIFSIWEYKWQYALIWTKWPRSQLNTCLAEWSRNLSDNLGMYKTYLQQIKWNMEFEDKKIQTFSVIISFHNCSRQDWHIHQLRFAPSSGIWPYPSPLICFWLMTWQTLSPLLTFTSTDMLPPAPHSGLSGFQPRLNTFTNTTGKFPRMFQSTSLTKYSSWEIVIFFIFLFLNTD